ncbi:MAG: MmgE/PrpD family protein, partial [Acidimicrobiales bacterium]|nr:MmgE/PrpD family protein [Acidimicrobiales bacterium]
MTEGFTTILARRASELDFTDIPDDAVEVARHCLLDWLGVTLAGSSESVAQIVRSLALEDEPG